jgi:hypothetical protein
MAGGEVSRGMRKRCREGQKGALEIRANLKFTYSGDMIIDIQTLHNGSATMPGTP